MEGPQTSSPVVDSCTNCKIFHAERRKPLGYCLTCYAPLYCPECSTTGYCGQECHDRNWKSLEPTLGFSSPEGPHNSGFDVINDMFGLSKDDFLHNRPEAEVFTLLIVSFKLRIKDEHVFSRNQTGVYVDGKPPALFQKFLLLAESRPHLLPGWWSPTMREKCEKLAVNSELGSVVSCVIEKSDVQDCYGDNMMPLKLRVLNEKICGVGIM
ncbi:hypothetical protein V492_00448 [Pseudogymnoascus sp. VKM F-4246]|nr:hypothetical protein V492_00448 [Pseudogymnoascus sp. VKM F-4246]